MYPCRSDRKWHFAADADPAVARCGRQKELREDEGHDALDVPPGSPERCSSPACRLRWGQADTFARYSGRRRPAPDLPPPQDGQMF